MASAVLFLGEPIEVRKVLGAAAVLAGVALTRAGGGVKRRRRVRVSDASGGYGGNGSQKRSNGVNGGNEEDN